MMSKLLSKNDVKNFCQKKYEILTAVFKQVFHPVGKIHILLKLVPRHIPCLLRVRNLHRLKVPPRLVIASASRTDDPGFESRQGVRFLGLDTLQCCC
jgi:hypothetical protein